MESYNNQSAVKTYASVAEQPPPSFTDQVMDRIRSVLGTVNEAESDLVMLFDRTFSVQGAPGQLGGQAQAPITSRAEMIFDLLDTLQQRASAAASTARALNSRI